MEDNYGCPKGFSYELVLLDLEGILLENNYILRVISGHP